MRKSLPAVSLTVFLALVLASCGSSSSMSTSPSAGSVPLSLTMSDDPPSGVTVLFFAIGVTGASLQPSNTSEPAVPLLTRHEIVEIGQLQTESALLGNLSVPAGTYTSLTMNFANPLMVIVNQSGSSIALGGSNCGNNQVCQFTPTLNQMSVTVQAPTQPFPLTLNSNSPVVLNLDFDLNSSIRSSNLSISPMVTVSLYSGQAPQPRIRLAGQITGVNAMAQTFTLQDQISGNTYTISTGNNTDYDFGSSCAAANFTCLMMNQFVFVDAEISSGTTLLATHIDLFSPPVQNATTVQGTVTQVNANAGTFQIAIGWGEEFNGGWGPVSFSPPFAPPVSVGLATGATFTIDDSGITLPTGLSFASLNDVTIGQTVRVSVTGTIPNANGPGGTAITASQVELEPSQVTGKVTSTTANPMTLVLGNLPPLFTKSGTASLNVDVLSSTYFVNVCGFSGISTGDLVSVNGLLFNPSAGPTVVAEAIRYRTGASAPACQ